MRYPRILARSDATNHGSPLSSVMTRTVLPSKSKTESALPEVDWIVILVLSVWAMETLPFYRPRPLRSSSPLGAFCFCCRCNYITQGGVFVIIVSVLYRHRSQRGMTCIFVVYRIFYFVISMPPALFSSIRGNGVPSLSSLHFCRCSVVARKTKRGRKMRPPPRQWFQSMYPAGVMFAPFNVTTPSLTAYSRVLECSSTTMTWSPSWTIGACAHSASSATSSYPKSA